MTIVLDGTTGITDVNGSASVPAITGVTTNTGMYFGTNTVGLATNGTAVLYIDASQNVGIGTTSPGQKLEVNNGAADVTVLAKATGANYASFRVTNSSRDYSMQIRTDQSNAWVLRDETGGANRLVVDTGGTVMVNSTTQVDSSKFQVVGATQSNNLIVLQDTGTVYGTSQFYQKFLNSSAAVAGSIQHTAVTTVAYSTTSDGRLKEDKGVATDMSVIDNTVIHDFVWKLDGLVDRGIFAQEAHLVKPTAISVGNDELTEDGNLRNPWGVDYSKYVPELIVYSQQLKKITQEQQTIITSLIARIEALENK